MYKSAGDKGKLGDERTGFTVITPCNLKNFMVFRTQLTEKGFSNVGAVFWFPPQEVGAGDNVVLYTKRGSSSVKKNEDGTTTYFFYWGLDSAIFSDEKKAVVLAKINTWDVCQ